MKQEIAFFLFELGLKSSARLQREMGPGSMFTSYKHFGSPEPLSRMDRPFGSGYQTHPELSRPFWAPAVHTAATRIFPAVGVASGVAAVTAVSVYVESLAIEEITSNESLSSEDKIRFLNPGW